MRSAARCSRPTPAAGFKRATIRRTSKSRGLLAPNKVEKVWDLNPSVGGPLVRDRFWFFFSGRKNVANNYVAGIFENKNAGKVDAWTYDPDLSKQALLDSNWWSLGMRLTLQASQRNKFNFYWDEQMRCVSCTSGGVAGTTAPEASVRSFAMPNRVQQVTWTSPLSNRILVEAGWGTYLARWGTKERPANNRALIPVQEQGGAIPGLNYRAAGWFNAWSGTYTWRGAVSLITGAHNAKFGYYGDDLSSGRKQFANDPAMVFRFNNGIPNQVTVQVRPVLPPTDFNTTSFYAQDSWSLGRLTLQGGVRYDHYRTHFPRQQLGPSPYLSNGPHRLRGIGRGELQGHNTANGRELRPVRNGAHGPENQLWTLRDRPGRHVDVRHRAEPDQSVRVDRGPCLDRWQPRLRPQLRSVEPGRKRRVRSDAEPELWAAGVQRPATIRRSPADGASGPTSSSSRPRCSMNCCPRISLNAGYYRRWFGNFMITDNLAAGPGDFDKFSVTSSTRSFRAAAARSRSTMSSPTRSGRSTKSSRRPRTTASSPACGTASTCHSARAFGKGHLPGGFSSGKTTTDMCEIVAQLPERNLRMPDTPLPAVSRRGRARTFAT